MIISLGRRLPDASSGLPGGSGEPPFRRPDRGLPGRRRLPIWPCSGWGLPSSRCHHRDWCALTAPFHPYPARRRGGLLSVALSVGSPPLAVSQHPALRSPDFPPRRPAVGRSPRRSSPPLQCLLYGVVCQLVGPGVALAPGVHDRPGIQLPAKGDGLGVELLEPRVSDPVDTR